MRQYIIYRNVFPETLYVMFLVNTPWAFRLIWKIVGNFIDPITYEKIKVLGSDYINEMTKYIPIDQIPPKYKGKGQIPIKYGHCSDLPHDRYPIDYYARIELLISGCIRYHTHSTDLIVSTEIQCIFLQNLVHSFSFL